MQGIEFWVGLLALAAAPNPLLLVVEMIEKQWKERLCGELIWLG